MRVLALIVALMFSFGTLASADPGDPGTGFGDRKRPTPMCDPGDPGAGFC